MAELAESLAQMEEDLANLYFFDEKDTSSVQIGWWDSSQLATNYGRFSAKESDEAKQTREVKKENVEDTSLISKEQVLEQF